MDSLILLLLIGMLEAVKINMVLVTREDARFGLVNTGPAYDLALEHAKEQYPEQFANVTMYKVYRNGTLSGCPAAGEEMMFFAAKEVGDVIKSLDGFTLMLTPGCSNEVLILGDFAREWNIPLFASSASDNRLTNKTRYPTTVIFGPTDMSSFAQAGKMLMDKYSWKTLALLQDNMTQYPTLTTVYLLLQQNVNEVFKDKHVYTCHIQYMNTGIVKNYDEILLDLRSRSRIIFVFAKPSIFREIMIAAARLGMTNGEFVFISPESTKQPLLGELNWYNNDTDDDIAFQAFQSVIVMAHPSPNWMDNEAVFESIAIISQSRYNKTLVADEWYNDVVVCAYEVTETIVTVIREAYSYMDQLSGRAFSRLFWNRTFSLDLQDIYVDATGMKKGDIRFLKLNTSSGRFEDVWFYSATSRTLDRISLLADHWYNRTKPPRDVPRCGFENDRCYVTLSQLSFLLPVIIVPVGMLLLTVIFVVVNWRYAQIKEQNSLWWYLDSTKFSEDLTRVSFTGVVRDESGRQDIMLKYSSKLRQYNGKTTWCETISPSLSVENIMGKRNLRKCLVAIHHLRHDNVGQFYGIATSKVATHFLWEFGAHGSLRTLLDSDSRVVTLDLVTSMIWDLLEGLSYIHSTELHYHGGLCSLTAMIDQRFCLKLSGYGCTKLLTSAARRNVASTSDALKLWLPPEMLVDIQNPGSKQSDMFSLAIVVAEMFTKSTPLDVILESESSREHVTENILMLHMHAPRILLTNEVPKMLHQILEDMMMANPKDRPALRIFVSRFERFFPKKGFIQKIMSRLQKYANDLEMRVDAQTSDLLEERRKVDALLREMIPQAFIDKLRNKETVPSEAFDSVTIFFSDLPAFSSICAASTPLQIIAMLNGLYSMFDSTLEEFDVYKVETINDSYMVASGLPNRNGQLHAVEISRMSLKLMGTKLGSSTLDGSRLDLRVGIHTGPCVAGIVGLRMPRYCLFGDTINTASRMESHGEASKIHVSPWTKDLLTAHGGFMIQSRGTITVKGKGEMETYWLLGQVSQPSKSQFLV